MPQINRIRVNNVKYNFGTQVYDDFVMRFNCQNTIYDLANGGGKSLLMLLLMQNMLPNCTLDDKQPIEKLFRQGSGNTCIHSLVEWKLDPCYQKDGFRFMTTGFCARKGRGTDDENQDGQEQTAAPTASVEYFNYCIFYREFGDNDIKNLPLVSNGERITYNGLKAYLRDLEKGGYKYVVKIFDRKGDYQSFISNYGIYESAWEIVRGINKTEGHVRTYFESNYKTSRKVVEDLLIEEIIQKSFNNKLSVDNDEGMMAQTLMDIKDKLVELSKKHSQLGAYDSQIAAIDSFKEYLSTYEAFYNRKEEIEKQLYNLLLVAMRESDKKDKELKSQDDLITKMYDELAQEKEAIAVAEVMSEKNSMAGVESLVNETRKALELKNAAIEEARGKLSLMESAGDYKDYAEYEKSYKGLQIAIDNRLREDTDITAELKILAAGYRKFYEKETRRLKEKLDIAANRVKALEVRLSEAKDNLRNADKEAAGLGSLSDNLENEIQELQTQLGVALSEAGTVVCENASEEYDKSFRDKELLKNEETRMSEKFNDVQQQLMSLNETISANKALIDIFTEQSEKLEKADEAGNADNERMGKIREIYSADNDEAMLSVILETYQKMRSDFTEECKAAQELENFIDNARKDRIAKGIEDMQMIKDNFENRCIQTCSNIKTELDRLPQLSNINLDGEQIAIISLQIPYIKEELYKEKMSEYIDETVFMAESFKEPAERLKYIRNRLSWKRLFSVIVTDMNSIRINLYKRERIKDQSRYLRYEEAVGSTGQSQGIYIQFLIAIINYISNMNSSGNEGVEGKTIFIDNPFGAAKDIYIWEPIFKLLATNHVQLIVPARGATPAITGRFDVNYILGQKLVDSRQQTVVVDYYSSTKESELEYTRMDYEQATFDFL